MGEHGDDPGRDRGGGGGDPGHEHDDGHGDDHGHHDHDHDHEHGHGHGGGTATVAVVTISTSRTVDDDPSGDAIESILRESGGVEPGERRLVADDRGAVRGALTGTVADPAADAVVSTGGTGVTPDDVTADVARELFDAELPGVGEYFRRLSHDEVGTRAVASRAVAGIVDGTPVFCLPGSENAATLGAREIVVPEAPHLAGLASRGRDGDTGTETGAGDAADAGAVHATPDDADAALTHADDGTADVVDVGGKEAVNRRAVAAGEIRLSPSTVAAVEAAEIDKGEVLATARIGAIRAVKHTWESIPLCHQIPVTDVDVAFDLREAAIGIEVAVETVGRTGCEMEALEGVTTGLNTVWDMTKSAEKGADGQYPETRIDDVGVVEKTVDR